MSDYATLIRPAELVRATTANVQSRRPVLPPDLAYDGFQSPAAGPASGRVSPESHDAIETIKAWS